MSAWFIALVTFLGIFAVVGITAFFAALHWIVGAVNNTERSDGDDG